MIIGLTGFAGSGKNEVAKILKKHYNFHSIAYADAIKDVLSILFGWNRFALEGITPEDRIWRETLDTWWSTKLNMDWSPRIAMQFIGTKMFRHILNSNIWIMVLENQLRKYDLKTDNIVITDCRFINELDMISKYGPVFQVERTVPEWINIGRQASIGDHESIKIIEDLGIHESEWNWLSYNLNGIITNHSNLTDLETNVISLMESLKNDYDIL